MADFDPDIAHRRLFELLDVVKEAATSGQVDVEYTQKLLSEIDLHQQEEEREFERRGLTDLDLARYQHKEILRRAESFAQLCAKSSSQGDLLSAVEALIHAIHVHEKFTDRALFAELANPRQV
ncbi:hypothetical protein CU669_20340 [Paramagnetospirillum kuznetsovii]|uniref:Hemerythrin-like domain-containing protein n=1 Tax=Paramagnetospirillum kuznetsovii TaxID=2053833 RepID=A0A364NSJ1_9PROT|nr:hypothetical protein [Paramagnetospirillum kuznetsovii]RAU20061.1 hypothetical protein CU669_20340 [Paramagnetospirillum kuznetsovii]